MWTSSETNWVRATGIARPRRAVPSIGRGHTFHWSRRTREKRWRRCSSRREPLPARASCCSGTRTTRRRFRLPPHSITFQPACAICSRDPERSRFMSIGRVLLSIVLVSAGGSVVAAQSTTAAISPQDLRRRLFALADDSMGGRRSGSLGDFKAAEYVAAELRRLGLQPAGEGGGWFQTVPFFIAQPAATTLTAGDATLSWGTDFVLAGRPLPLVQLRGAAVVYGGVVSDSATWMPAGQAGGKVVVLDVRPGADGERQLVRGLTRIAMNLRFTGAAAVAVVELDLLAPEVLYLIAGERLTADTSRGAGQPAIALITP